MKNIDGNPNLSYNEKKCLLAYLAASLECPTGQHDAEIEFKNLDATVLYPSYIPLSLLLTALQMSSGVNFDTASAKDVPSTIFDQH